MKGRWIAYSAAELRFIEARRTMNRRELLTAFTKRFGRDDVQLMHLNALCKRRGWMTGRDGQFVPGQVPPNKGKPRPFHPNSAATQFKAGARLGKAALNWMPIGSERLTKDGYSLTKVSDIPGVHQNVNWRLTHLLRWEAANGPVPKGMALKSLDGDRRNTDPSNWTLVPRAVLPRLAGGRRQQHVNYDTAPAELKPVILATAKLAHAAHAARTRRGASA